MHDISHVIVPKLKWTYRESAMDELMQVHKFADVVYKPQGTAKSPVTMPKVSLGEDSKESILKKSENDFTNLSRLTIVGNCFLGLNPDIFDQILSKEMAQDRK